MHAGSSRLFPTARASEMPWTGDDGEMEAVSVDGEIESQCFDAECRRTLHAVEWPW